MTFQRQADKNPFQFHIIFLGMNLIKDHAATHTKANIKDMRTLYLDLDRNGDDFLQAIRSSGEVPPPNFVLNASPGKDPVVWKINGLRQAQAEALLRTLASEFIVLNGHTAVLLSGESLPPNQLSQYPASLLQLGE